MTNGGSVGNTPSATAVDTELVVRSVVPQRSHYREYKAELRYDFFHACAYCTMSEAEAQAIRFTIDHYEPPAARPDLEHDYANLMFACDECNIRKGDRCPPASARLEGHRFFRPDNDRYSDHFRRNGIRVSALTNVGSFSIDALDLNRLSLRRIREIRERLAKCDQLVLGGVRSLRDFPIDQLPTNIRAKAVGVIQNAVTAANNLRDQLDSLLRSWARSPLLDDDPEIKARTRQRLSGLRRLEAIYPETWRARDLASRKRGK